MGIRVAGLSAGRGIWVVDPQTNEPAPDQQIIVRSASMETVLTTNADGWADWPVDVTAGSKVDIVMPYGEFSENAWMGVTAGCVALTSQVVGGSVPSLGGGRTISIVKGSLRVKLGRLPPGEHTLLVRSFLGPTHGARVDIPAGAVEIDVDLNVPLETSFSLQTFVIGRSEMDVKADWSNLRGWAGTFYRLNDGEADGVNLGELTVAPIVQDYLTMTLPADALGPQPDGTEVARSFLSKDQRAFFGASVALVEGTTQLALPAPEPDTAKIEEFEVQISSSGLSRSRWAQAETTDGRHFVSWPLLTHREPMTVGERVALGPRDSQANLTAITGGAFRLSDETAGGRLVVYILDDRAELQATPLMRRLSAMGSYSVFLRDIRLAEDLTDETLSEPLTRILANAWSSISL